MLSPALLVCVCAALKIGTAQETVVQYRDVEIAEQGTIRGFRAPNTDVFRFYNVPYATTPIGADKFKAPLPPPRWSEVFQAVNRNIGCPQNPATINPAVNLVEDCLVANIFVPDTEATNLPVLVIVHGGAFLMGYGNIQEPTALINNNDIIAVSFNYRLGVHGFLCLGNEAAPGNAGFKDQVALLRWVQRNIASFGGNPNDVTVSGCSAGGASIDMLVLSDLTNGLMNKAISESGSSLSPMSLQYEPLQLAKDFATRLEFSNVDDMEALTEFYKSLSFDELFQGSSMSGQDSSVGFSGCVETDIGEERFLDDAPLNILRNRTLKNIPMIFGYSDMEGAFRYGMFNQWQTMMNDRFSDFLPANLGFESEEQREEVANSIKEFYFGSQNITQDSLLAYFDYFTDVMFVQSILASVRLHVEAGNNQVYLHEYSFTRSDRPAVPGLDIPGANHCFQYDTVMDENEAVLPTDYVQIKAIMREIWRNFVRNGNPTPTGLSTTIPTWPPTGANRSPHFALDGNITIGEVPVPDRTAFWDPIYKEYARLPSSHSVSVVAPLFSTLLILNCIALILKLR